MLDHPIDAVHCGRARIAPLNPIHGSRTETIMPVYASQNAARRGILCARNGDNTSCLYHSHARTNIILDVVREYQSGDEWGECLELLYALHRLWNDYQTPEVGTSPIDAWDAGDESPLYDSVAPMLAELANDDAARMIVHATRVAQLYASMLELAGRDY